MTLLDDCCCTRCGSSALVAEGTPWTPSDIHKGAIRCRACTASYDVIWGSPFLGHYESHDITGLIEIAANAREDNPAASSYDIRRIEGLLQRYHQATDRDAFMAECADPCVRAPWFQNRYTEYSSFVALADDVDFADRDILDVGAGSGYDTWRLVQAGGRVTAVEYNPMLIRRGRSAVPEARWFGAFAHALPFGSESFDVVCCNAALHHMRDVPSAMHEMLRVLRPGGWLLTTGDPFRADHYGEDVEFEVFDRHPDVLLGVNESLPTFCSLVETLEVHKDRLEVTFLTSTLYGMRVSAFQPNANIFENRTWPFTAVERLARASGTISIKVRVKEPLQLGAKMQDGIALRAGDYASVLTDYEAAVGTLVDLLPTGLLDRSFPGERQTKFELLNGWQKPQSGMDYRTGYKRARWFLSMPDDASALRFQARRFEGKSATAAALEVRVNGAIGTTVDLPPHGDWQEVAAPLAGVAPNARFVCELRLLHDKRADAQFEDYVFAVKHRAFA
jgi:SAM-dependent methyltransferase